MLDGRPAGKHVPVTCSCSCNCRITTDASVGVCHFCRGRWSDGPLHHGVPAVSDDDRTITLTQDEVARARALADHIVAFDVKEGWSMYFDPGGGESRWDVNFRGFGAELAVARYTGLPRNEQLLDAGYRRRLKPPDVGRRVEVRCGRSASSPLYIYEADPAQRYAVLVTGSVPVFRIVGWIVVRDAKVDRFWRTDLRYPAWAVPQSMLRAFPLPPDA